jgi:spermidine/putrescine transport system ATP-binding protein
VQAHLLVRRFGDTVALAGVSLSIRAGEFFSLLGPSGCGKTTLLRIVAGLDYPDEGSLRIGGVDALPVPAHRRPVNTVFQSYALFPHLSVRDNIAFGLRMKKVSPADVALRVGRVMELAQIARLADRRPDQLSGGEKQRVALARALVNEPQVLLLDEPLGALDLKLRRQLQQELHTLQRRLGVTFIYVTHDQDEALAMSDRIAVLNAGQVEQTGTGEQLYERPRNRFVAQFLGGCNLLEIHQGRTTLGPLRWQAGPHPCSSGPRTLAIRPQRIHLDEGGAQENCVEAAIVEVLYRGAETLYLLQAGPETLKVTVMNQARDQQRKPGQTVRLYLPPEALVPLED